MSDPSTDSTPKSDPSNCSSCGVELEPQSAPRGLCPRCLMAEAMVETETPEADRTTKPEPPDMEAVQAAFPQLKVLELIGVGGMGMVYKARQKSLRRHVALKLLSPHRGTEPGFAERFAREAQALAALNHPNIVTVHDFGEADGFFYLLMEYVDGVNLRQAINNERFTPEQALAIVPPICEALQFAHDRGIVHRDIKPENLLLDKDGRIKVADFGIARILDQDPLDYDTAATPPALDADTKVATDSDPGLTGDTKLGTPRYMAPEQSEHPEQVDHRADIYSLGVVFYELLTGEAPGGRLTPPSSRVAVDVRLDEVVLRALADSPELRWQTAADLRTQVETIVSDKTSRASSSVSLANVGPPPLPEAVSSNPTISAPGTSSATVAATPPTGSTPAPAKKGTNGCLVAAVIGGVGLLLLVLAFLAIRFYAMNQSTPHDPKLSAEITKVQSDLNVADAERRRARNLLSQHSTQFPDFKELDKNSRAAREGLALEKELAGATRHEQSLRTRLAHLNQGQPPTAFRLPFIALLLLAVVGGGISLLLWWIFRKNQSAGSISPALLALAVPVVIVILFFTLGVFGVVAGGIGLMLWWGFSKKRSAGFIALALFALALPLILIALYLTIGVTKIPVDSPTQSSSRIESGATHPTGRYILRRGLIQSVQSSETSKEPSQEFACKFDTIEVAKGWELWLTHDQNHTVDGKLRSSGAGSQNIQGTGQGRLQLDDLEWNDQLQKDIQFQLQKWMGQPITVESGTAVSIVRVTDSKGETLDISVELRPEPDFSGQPATQIFVREVDSKPTEGYLALAFNEILTVEGYDLVLETHGATARFDSHEQLENAKFSAINDSDQPPLSRIIIHQSGSLRFDFPEIADFDITSLMPGSGISVKVHQYRPWRIFDITDLESGHRAWAELQLVPTGTVEEILRRKLRPAPRSLPRVPLPLYPRNLWKPRPTP